MKKVSRKFERKVKNSSLTVMRNGIKIVHIGSDVWRIGRDKVINGKKHQVIYGPENKEFHLWDDDVDFVNKKGSFEPDCYYYDLSGVKHTYDSRRVIRDGNRALESKVKIYILTHILDNKENWVFDLSVIPEKGKLKIIYSNGTVKNIEFDGEFKDGFIPYKWDETKTKGNMVAPFAYRKL